MGQEKLMGIEVRGGLNRAGRVKGCVVKGSEKTTGVGKRKHTTELTKSA